MQLMDFQIDTISRLNQAVAGQRKEIVLKSCTGSGKTIILTNFMSEYSKSHFGIVFVWLTPGKGDLEEQSKEKMDRYIRNAQTKTLAEVMQSGFTSGDMCFINWEKLAKKGNNALKDGERQNFIELVNIALNEGLSFKVIVDESHQNDTIKAKDIIEYFKADKIIHCSATPNPYNNAELIEVDEKEVIAAGLIKKVLIINENFDQKISVESQIDYLLSKALTKQRELYSSFKNRGKDINPLIIVQLPNNNEVLLDNVETWFESKGINYENGQLSVWLDKKKENRDGLENNDAKPIAVIIKQAIATGWDCPRAQILVKMRDNMSETFEIQTIGRIRRMPEAKHYNDMLMDSCYLYTFDENFTESVKQALGKDALDAKTLQLKPEHKNIELVSEKASGILGGRDANECMKAIYSYYKKQFGINGKTIENKNKLTANHFVFDKDIINYTKSGDVVSEINKKSFSSLNDISITTKLSTHIHGRDYHNRVGEIGLRLGIVYEKMNVIIRRFFDKNVKPDTYRILGLDTKEVYAFVINNFELLKNTFRNATSYVESKDLLEQSVFALDDKITKTKFILPRECLFTYDANAKFQSEMEKNVYLGYRSSAAPRSTPEKDFEKYCDKSSQVDWWYKNGDKGNEFFSIAYEDSFKKVKLFYPDYVVSISSKIWIIETKGGFDRYGNSQDIDKFTQMKFAVLRNYLNKNKLDGGIVRFDENERVLCICTDNYNDDIKSDSWKLLNEIM